MRVLYCIVLSLGGSGLAQRQARQDASAVVNDLDWKQHGVADTSECML